MPPDGGADEQHRLTATRGAVERAAEALESEVVAIVRGDSVIAAIGYPQDALPEDELVRLAREPERGELTALGPCRVAVVQVDGDVVTLRLLDPLDHRAAVLMASVGLDPGLKAALERAPADEGLGGRAIAEDRLVVAGAAMAAPVREEGRVVGSIVVASRRPGRRHGHDDREVLSAFAEHASLALTDARMDTRANQDLAT